MGTSSRHRKNSAGRALLLAAATLAAASGAHAADGTITIQGTVTAETCTINGGGSASSFNVSLPNVSPNALATAGAVAGLTRFTIALTNCTGFTSGAVFPYFEPSANINAAGRLNNLAGAPKAANVDVELLNASFNPINLMGASGSQNALSANVSGNSATLTYYARYRAFDTVTGGNPVTPGNVSTNVTYSIIYP